MQTLQLEWPNDVHNEQKDDEPKIRETNTNRIERKTKQTNKNEQRTNLFG